MIMKEIIANLIKKGYINNISQKRMIVFIPLEVLNTEKEVTNYIPEFNPEASILENNLYYLKRTFAYDIVKAFFKLHNVRSGLFNEYFYINIPLEYIDFTLLKKVSRGNKILIDAFIAKNKKELKKHCFSKNYLVRETVRYNLNISEDMFDKTFSAGKRFKINKRTLLAYNKLKEIELKILSDVQYDSEKKAYRVRTIDGNIKFYSLALLSFCQSEVTRVLEGLEDFTCDCHFSDCEHKELKRKFDKASANFFFLIKQAEFSNFIIM